MLKERPCYQKELAVYSLRMSQVPTPGCSLARAECTKLLRYIKYLSLENVVVPFGPFIFFPLYENEMVYLPGMLRIWAECAH